jgi:hypothetical protein
MLNKENRDLVYEHVYIPEHLPSYVEAISGQLLEARKGNALVAFSIVDMGSARSRAK